MIALGDVALLRPWWLLALPLLALLFVLTKPKSGTLASWQRAVDAPLLAAMVARGGTSGTGRVWTPIVLAVIIGIVALCGPAVRSADQDHLRNLDATLIVMDLSQDVTGGAQLRTAASAAHDVLDHSSARQAGLILYAGDAYLASALTDDTNGIDPLLFALDDKTVPDPGARPDRALALARKVLRDAHIIQGDVVLITGGGGLEGEGARKEAAALRAAGHRVDVLAVTGGASDERRSGAVASLAAAGGGLADDALAPQRVLAALSDQSIQHLGSSAIVAIGWRDVGRLLLIVAAFPLLLGFRRVAT